MKIINRGEPKFVTSSIGQIAFLLWHNILPDDLTFPPDVACVYYTDSVNWGEMINSYWMGEKIPVCELAECANVAKKILDTGEIEGYWFLDMHDAIVEVRQDYVFPVYE